MTHLVPVQRHDRNGKLVTRYVKPTDGVPSTMGKLPAPKLWTPDSPALSVLTEGVQLVPKQTSPKKRLASGVPAAFREVPVFSASEVEMYGVLSVASPSTALRLLAEGARTAEEAEVMLHDQGLGDELLDNAEIAHQMLLRRVPAEFYLMSMERLTEEQIVNAQPSLLADYAEFFSIRSIMRKDSWQVADEVLRGEISLYDVRQVGIENLKIQNSLEISRPAFRALHQGTDKFTTADLTHVLQHYDPRTQKELTLRVQFMVKYGMDALRGLERIGMDGWGGVSMSNFALKITPDDMGDRDEMLAIVDYVARCIEVSDFAGKRHTKGMMFDLAEKGKDLYRAGVSVEFAAKRIHGEETAREITADYEGTHGAIGSGWL